MITVAILLAYQKTAIAQMTAIIAVITVVFELLWESVFECHEIFSVKKA